MNKFILIIILFFALLIPNVNAESQIVFSSQSEFEKYEGDICESATDGCNNFFIQDGKVMGGTEMFCENHKEIWRCTKYMEEDSFKMCTEEYSPVCGVDGNTYSNLCKAGNIKINYKGQCENTLICTTIDDPVCGIDGKTYSNSCFAGDVEIDYKGECENPIMCTEQYEPVCGVDGKTYSNECFAVVDIDYSGECINNSILSDNDLRFYKNIKSKLDITYQDKINLAIYDYKIRLSKKDSNYQKTINDKIILRVEDIISEFLLKFPADKSLPKSSNDIYLTLSLLKFELMLIEIK